MYSVSIRACNRYQPHKQDGSYITVCAYRMFYTHAHTLLGMLIAYRTKLLSPLSSKTRTSASWLTTPLFIFRLFPVCGSVPRSHRGKLFQYVKYLFVFPTLQTYNKLIYLVYFFNIYYKLSLFFPKSI